MHRKHIQFSIKNTYSDTQVKTLPVKKSCAAACREHAVVRAEENERPVDADMAYPAPRAKRSIAGGFLFTSSERISEFGMHERAYLVEL